MGVQMMKKILLFLIVVLLLHKTLAQNPRQIIDSLKSELKKNPDKVKKAAIYSDLTWYYSSLSIDSALAYGKHSLAFGKSLKNPKIISQAYSDLGSVYLSKGDLSKARTQYFQSLSIRTKQKDFEGMASNWSNIGGIYQRKNILDTAMIYYLKSLKYYESVQNERNVDFLKNNIAVLYEDMRNFPKAIKMYREVAEYRKRNGQNIQLAIVYSNMGNLFKKTKATAEAESYFKQSITLSAAEGDSLLLGNTYTNLGALYNSVQATNQSVPVLEKARQILKNVNSDFDLALTEYALAIAYGLQKDYLKSKNLYLKSIKTMLPLGANEYVSSMYLNLIPIYANLNKPDSALFYTEKYKAFQEKQIENKVSLETAELEAKYQSEKKEKLLLQKESETKNKNILLLLISVFAVFIGILGFLFFKQQRLKNKQLLQEHELKLAISKIETQNKLQEQRLSISRDLHDNIGAQLTFIISSVDNIKYGFSVENGILNSKLDRINSFARTTISELRDTIWAMNSDSVTFKDVELRIMNFIEKAKKAQESVDFEFHADEKLSTAALPSIVGMNLYRTVQESINNAMKYAEAKQISIRTSIHQTQITTVISDNGKGFDLQNVTPGNGLQNMKKRIREIGGEINIVSAPGKGTSITIIFDQG